MSDVETKAVELMDRAANGLDALTAKLAAIAEQYGPEVVDAGLNVARITAGQYLVAGLVLVAMAYLLGRQCVRWSRAAETACCGPDVAYEVGMVFGGIGAVLSGIGAVVALANIWNWVGLFEPKLWIAHRVLGW